MSAPTSRDSDKFMLRLPTGMRDRIKAAADSNNRSMNAEIVAALEEKYPGPQNNLELATLASWLDYVQSGGPEDKIYDRVFEVNGRLATHPAIKDLHLVILVNGEGDDLRPELVLDRRIPDK